MPKDGELITVSAYQALPAKDKLFAKTYALTGSTTQAAMAGGWNAKTAEKKAYTWLEKRGIREAVDELRQKAASELKLSKDSLLLDLYRNHELALEGNPVLDRYGNPTGQIMRQLSSSNKALDQISELLGLKVDRKAIMTMDVTNMSVQELEEAEAKLEAEIAKFGTSSTNGKA